MTDVQIPGYKTLRSIGEGGMATVYLAMQESLDREVALKVMSPMLAANESFCEQFIKEGRITAKLTHPHLVTVHDIGSHNGVYYLASEYLPAGTLHERLQQGVTIAEAMEVVRDIASGLAYAHDKGFVHRDVKPGNIMFRANGSAVLADFGIAKAIKSVSSATMAGNAIGTPDYMSPEQAQATEVDGRSDIYSLGAVLYEMLTGSRPYRAKDPYAVALMQITEPVPRLPDSLAWLQPLIDGTMAKQASQRYPTADAFIQACDALVAANPGAANPSRMQRTTGKRAVPRVDFPARGADGVTPDRIANPRLRIGLAVAAAVFVLAASVAAWHWFGATPEKDPTTVGGTKTTGTGSTTLPPEPSDNADPIARLGIDKWPTVEVLTKAQQHLTRGLKSEGAEELSFPDGDNAIDLFNEVLRREPENPIALKGAEQIATFFRSNAASFIKKGLNVPASEFVEKGLRAKPNDAELLKMKQQLETP